jgi:sugar phosphate permease
MNPVQWFFIIGGAIFLMVALFLRELNNEAAQIVALTFGLIGFFWLVPQLIIAVVRNRRGS